MSNESMPWAAPDLGAMPGRGNERPGGGAEIKPELEPGLSVVRYLYDNSRVDDRWSVLDGRGYTWWADDLAQRVWSEPGFDDDGIEIYRVFTATDVVRGIDGDAATLQAIDALNGLSAGSALVFDRQDGAIKSIASMWVHEESRDWVARSFSVIAAIQVAQASQAAAMLSTLTDGEPATSAHPDSGPRSQPDEMLSLLEMVAADGQGPSGWVGDGMEMALVQLRVLPVVVQANGDATGISLEVPYRETTALIRMDTSEAHPGLGNGMVVRLSLPGAYGPGPTWAAMRNQQEVDLLTRAHLIGSWVGSASSPTFVSFYPNMLARTGMGAVNVALSMINRAAWIATEGRTTET